MCMDRWHPVVLFACRVFVACGVRARKLYSSETTMKERIKGINCQVGAFWLNTLASLPSANKNTLTSVANSEGRETVALPKRVGGGLGVTIGVEMRFVCSSP